MAQVFLSYASADRDRVQPLVAALEADGYSVWWDRDIRPGPSFDREIEKAIDDATCMVVVWSAHSIDSEWVRSEAEEGVRRGMLVPVILDQDVMPPLAYRRRQSADLSDWNGEQDTEYEKLLAGIEAATSTEQPAPVRRARRRRRRTVPFSMTLGIALASLMIGAAIMSTQTGPREAMSRPEKVSRFSFDLPGGAEISNGVNTPLFITRDGYNVVMNVQTGPAVRQLIVRSMDELAPKTVSGLENRASQIFGSIWGSPDSEWVIFHDGTERSYLKVRLIGGTPVKVADTGLSGGGIRGLAWHSNGNIIYANNAQPGLVLLTRGAAEPELITSPDEGFADTHPAFLLDETAILFSRVSADGNSTEILLMDLATRDVKKLLDGGTPKPTASGHLLYTQDELVWATAFDAGRQEVYGRQVPVLEGIHMGGSNPMGTVDVADDGTLVYLPATGKQDAELWWKSNNGVSKRLPIDVRGIRQPKLSPDGSRLVFVSFEAGRAADLWVHVLATGTTTRLTFAEDFDVEPAWTPDGESIVYARGFPGQDFGLVIRPADGTGTGRVLTTSAHAKSPFVTPDGQAVVFSACTDQCDLVRVSLASEPTLDTLLRTTFNETNPAVSPNMKWIAYGSTESGRSEVYVRPYPEAGDGRWQVSNGGGQFPTWSTDGSRLYFVEPDTSRLMVVDVTETPTFAASIPVAYADLSEFEWQALSNISNLSLDPEDDRVYSIRSTGLGATVNVVLHWFTELEELVPTDPTRRPKQ